MGVLQMPDGRQIQVPNGATPEQVKAIYQASENARRERSAQAGRDAAWEDTPWYGKAAIGFAKPFVETGLGIKSLFTNLDNEDENLLDAGKGVKGVAGVGGEIAGNLATFALPGGAAGKVGTKAVSMLPNATRALKGATRLAPQAAALGGMEALKAPTDERSRGDAALQGVGGALVGAGVGRVLSKTLAGVNRSGVGSKMLSDGVELTPGMASKGSVIPWIEQRMSAIPFVGGKVGQLQGKALDQWNAKTLQSVAPAGTKISRIGQDGFQDLSRAYKKSYDSIWNQPIPLRFNPAQSWFDLTEQAAKTVSSKQTKQIVRNLMQVDEILQGANRSLRSGQRNGKALEQIDDMLRDFMKQASRKGDDQVADIYKAARDSFRASLPENVTKTLAAVDGQYAKFAIVRDAATRTAKGVSAKSVFTPADLMQSVKKAGSPGQLSRGKALLQNEASEAVDTIGTVIAKGRPEEQLLMGGAALAGGLAFPQAALVALGLPREVTRKIMTGFYKDKPTEFARVLARYGTTPSSVAAAAGSATNDQGR